MEVYYNSFGVPYIIKDGVLYDFNTQQATQIIPDVALDIDFFNQIKVHVLDSIRNISDIISNANYDNNLFNFIKEVEPAFYLNQLSITLNVLSEMEDLQYQAITPQPYPSWQWDKSKKSWVSPLEIPEGAVESNIQWDEASNQWIPLEPSPYDGWVWDWNTQTWNAPIEYPLGASENEFIWSNELGTWILNDQAG